MQAVRDDTQQTTLLDAPGPEVNCPVGVAQCNSTIAAEEDSPAKHDDESGRDGNVWTSPDTKFPSAIDDISQKEEGKTTEKQDKNTSQLNAPACNGNNPALAPFFDSTDPDSPISQLPLELRREVVSNLDRDPFSLISLSLVSRTWNSTLMQGKMADADWKRRAEILGCIRRSPGTKNWKESYIQALKRRCIRCFRISSNKVGILLNSGPLWVKVCRSCQSKPGPFQLVPQWYIPQICLLSEEHLKYLRFKPRYEYKRDWVKDSLLKDVVELEKRVIDRLCEDYNGSEENAKSLREAIEFVKTHARRPVSPLLDGKIRSVLRRSASSDLAINEALGYYEKIIKAKLRVGDAVRHSGCVKDKRIPPALDSLSPSSPSLTGLEAIVESHNQISEYVEAVGEGSRLIQSAEE